MKAAPGELVTDVEFVAPRHAAPHWRVWFGTDASLPLGVQLVAERAASRASDSPCDGLHAQRCQAARELALEAIAADVPLIEGRRPPRMQPSASTFAALYGLQLAESGKRGRMKRGARA